MSSCLKRLALAAGLLLVGPGMANAACSRALNVPVGPMGITITVDSANQIGGIFPDMLRAAGAAAGCEFTWSVAPRARVEAMFEAGQVDLLLAASRTAKREQIGIFVPMVATRATMLSIDAKRPPVRSIAELLARRELRVALVRGYDYGEAYNAAVQKLGEQNRLILDSTAGKVARLINEGVADVTIMTAVGMAGAITADERLAGMMDKLRVEPLEELPWGEMGIYISRQTVSPDDAAQVEKIIVSLGKKKTLWEAYKRYYPAGLLVESIRLP
jgi:polar amino acid transport system substrate-binding protein